MARNRYMAAYLLGATFMPAALYATDLPTNPQVVAGSISITNPTATQLLVQQSGAFGIVNWGGFSIAQGFGVQVNNGAGATLNRVTGGDASSIMGSLNATGSVFLINPNGIIIGKTGVVNTGGRFVATTLDVGNDDFLNGGDTTFSGDSAASVVNLGQVSSMGGDVALMARHVVNEGTLSAPNGTVGEVAGREILMRDASVDDGMFVVKVGGSDTSVTDAGAIRAAAAELRANGGNVFALAGNTQGTIQATGVAKVAGRVFLTADNGNLKVTKTVKAQNADGTGGNISAHGKTVDLAGTLDASGSKGGTVQVTGDDLTNFDGQVYATGGGFVEISGGELNFAGDVDTGGGTLLIDPNNIEITNNNSTLLSNASIVSGFTIERELLSQNVIVQTNGASGQAGTIVVSTGISWSTAFSLTLLARGDLIIYNSIQNSSDLGGDVNLVAGWNGTTSTTAFDPAPFLAANLATTTLFGGANDIVYSLTSGGVTISQKATGSFFIAQNAGSFQTTAVGSRSGATRLFADGGNIGGGNGYAQLGYNVSNQSNFTASGDIIVRSTGVVNLVAGTSSGAGAQIGHIGINTGDIGSGVTADATGSITVEALGGVSLWGSLDSTGNNQYAMIGNGSLDSNTSLQTQGNRSGDITIITQGDLSLQSGTLGSNVEAWIGHATAAGTISASNQVLTAAAFDQDPTVNVGPGGTGTIDIRMLATNTLYGNVNVTATNSALILTGDTSLITCECSFISSHGNFIVQTSGDLTLDSTFSYGNNESSSGAGDSGGGLVLASGGNVINNAGVGAIGPMFGQWLIYSDRPDHDAGLLGVLSPDENIFGLAYNPADPFASTEVLGNALVYAKAPLINVTDATITYGQTYTPGTIAMTVDGTSEVIANPASWGFAFTAPSVDPTLVTFSSDGFINAGLYTDVLKTVISSTGAGTNSGYFFSDGNLTVNRATITVGLADQTKPYDGVGLYTGAVTYTGFQGTDTQALITSGPTFGYAGGDGSGVNAGTYTVSASGVTQSSSNYVINQTATAQLVIDPLALSVALIGTPTKTYDGTNVATLNAGNYQLTGFIAGQGATIGQTAGTYGSASIGRQVVSTSLTPADFLTFAGTDLSNYSISGAPIFSTITVSGPGAILPATRSVTSGPLTNPAAPPGMDDGFSTTSLGFPVGPADFLQTIDTETTQRILDEINAGANFCREFVQPEYAIDCLSDRLQSVADGLSATGEYSEVRSALEDAAQKLHAIATSNESSVLAQAVAHSTSGPARSSSRPLVAISKANLASANAAATAIIVSTQLVLLRSSANSERRSVAFQQIGQVLGTTKVLLRSS